MTKEETIKVLQMLNAFYAGGKGNPKEQVIAWHLIMGKYAFEDAMTAVLHFAENDTRQYATFPAVGLIVDEIRKAEKARKALVDAVMKGISYGTAYEDIKEEAKALISKERYDEWLSIKADVFQANAGTYRQILLQKQEQLEQSK